MALTLSSMASILLLRKPPPFRLAAFSNIWKCTSTIPLRSYKLTQPKGFRQNFHSTVLRRNPNSSDKLEAAKLEQEEPLPHKQLQNHGKNDIYHGPLASTFRRLKIFSLSCLTVCFTGTPILFMIETTSSLPLVARFALAGIALSSSGISTGLVSWCGKPYVSTLRWLPSDPLTLHDGTKGPEIVEMTTHTLALRERVTRVYDTAFLVPTSRPFAKWELAEAFTLSPSEVEAEKTEGVLPREETVAETTDHKGNVIGRWVVHWDENGVGKCREHGQIIRYAAYCALVGSVWVLTMCIGTLMSTKNFFLGLYSDIPFALR